MGKLNNYAGVLALLTLGLVAYKIFVVDGKKDAASFLGRLKK